MQEMQETWVQSLGWEDPPRVGNCSILAWRIPWTEEPGGLQSMGLQRVRHDRTHTDLHIWALINEETEARKNK